MKTEIRKIYEHRPCCDGFAKLLNGFFGLEIDADLNIAKQFDLLTDEQKDAEISLLEILDINGAKDAFWCLRCWHYDDYCLLNANVAESVLHIFEDKYPGDERPKLAIEAIRKYKTGDISKSELDANATYAADAADATYDAADDADDADAAAAAATAATYAATDAADDAADDAAYAAAAAADDDAAADAADAAATARKKQWQESEKLMREFLKLETNNKRG